MLTLHLPALQDDKPTESGAMAESKTEKSEDDFWTMSEPTSEALHNMTRITPAQMAYVAFPSVGRYQPVRPITTSTASVAGPATAMKKGKRAGQDPSKGHAYAGLAGGGIIMLRDTQPEEPGEYEELTASLDAPPAAAAASDVAAEPAAAPMEVDEGPELEMPAPFEVSESPPCKH